MELITNRRNHGEFSGDVLLSGQSSIANPDRAMAFIPIVSRPPSLWKINFVGCEEVVHSRHDVS